MILWQGGGFITPGLHAKEKRYAVPFVATSLLLFVSGVGLAYLTFPHALRFLQNVGGPSLRQITGPTSIWASSSP